MRRDEGRECDRLEVSLSTSDTTHRQPLDGLLADALAPLAPEISVTHWQFSLDSISSGITSRVETGLYTLSLAAPRTGAATIARFESLSSSRIAIAAGEAA